MRHNDESVGSKEAQAKHALFELCDIEASIEHLHERLFLDKVFVESSLQDRLHIAEVGESRVIRVKQQILNRYVAFFELHGHGDLLSQG